MPRIARFAIGGLPYHVTQRGNRRGRVFFSDADRLVYLHWLREYAARFELDVLAYCLMTNHVHLVAAPATDVTLARVLRPLHLRYAQRINRRNGWKGHLWQGRYFASALDEPYLWAAIRYVELNPVNAGMVARAADYQWSSAPAHCGGKLDPVLTRAGRWGGLLGAVADWTAWLAMGESSERVRILKRNGPKGLPCGSDEFVESLERQTGRVLRYRPQGGQVKADSRSAHAAMSPELGFQFTQLLENPAEPPSERRQAVFDMGRNFGESLALE